MNIVVVILGEIFREPLNRADKWAQEFEQAFPLGFDNRRGLNNHERAVRQIGRSLQNDDVSLNMSAIRHEKTRFPVGTGPAFRRAPNTPSSNCA